MTDKLPGYCWVGGIPNGTAPHSGPDDAIRRWSVVPGEPPREDVLWQIAALKSQRDAAIHERDAARRELCERGCIYEDGLAVQMLGKHAKAVAFSRGWSYLYDSEKEGER